MEIDEMSCLAFIRLLVTAILASMYGIVINCHNCSDSRLRFVGLTDCQGQAGSNFFLKTIKNVEGVECVKKCYETSHCMVFFHNSKTRSCSLHNRTLTDIEMTPDDSSSCYSDDNIVESWITGIISVSSSHNFYSETNLIGPSDYQMWLQKSDHRTDVITVRFSSEMYIEQIHIYEMHTPGGVSGISLLTPNGTWYPVWSTDQVEVSSGHRIFSPDLKMTVFKTSTVRIDIGARSTFERIDAVRVVGKTRVKVP